MQSSPQQPPYYQQPYQPPAPVLPVRKPRRWPWFVALILVAIVFYSAGRASVTSTTQTASTDTTSAAPSTQHQSTDQKPVPTQKPLTWQTTHTFTGNGTNKTETFSVPASWKLQWKCDPASFSPSYNVIVTIYNADGTTQDLAINTLCKTGNTSGETTLHQAGSIYLDTNSEGSWTLTVQEQK